jgi:hypothetical protein
MGVVFSADFETGNLDQLKNEYDTNPAEDSGDFVRAMSTEQAHSGIYSVKMTINTTVSSAGVRTFRKKEAWENLQPYYYGCWFYFPEVVEVSGFWNIWQFKTNTETESDVAWKLEARNFVDENAEVQHTLLLVWDGQEFGGPFAGDPVQRVAYAPSEPYPPLPIGEWFHIEVYLRQSEVYDGQIIVWLNGVELFNKNNVRTKHTGGFNNWSVNNYGDDHNINPHSIYVDDMVVSTIPIYPLQVSTVFSVQPDETASQDTFIHSGTPTANYGALNAVAFGEFNGEVGVYRTLIKFSLGAIPSDAIIQSAKMSLFPVDDKSSNGRIARCYRQKRTWIENSATYNSYNGTNNWQIAGGFGADDCEQTEIGVLYFSSTATLNQFHDFFLDAAAVQEWVSGAFFNNGLLIKMDTENNDGYTFTSSTFVTASQRPKLEILYTLPEEAEGTSLRNELLGLVFQASSIPLLARNAITAPLTSLYVSLHTSDPDEDGNQSTSEADYGSYARVAVSRNSGGWTVTDTEVRNLVDINFPTATSGTNVLTHFAIGTSASGGGKIFYRGTLSSPITIVSGTTPKFKANQLVVLDEE